MLDFILIIIGLLVLLIGSATDIHRREIPDWISFSFLFFGIGINLTKTILELDIWYILLSIAGVACAYAIGALLYYTGQWGGGDAKVLMSFGALFGPFTYTQIDFGIVDITQFLGPISAYNPHFLVVFVLNILIIGAGYSILWTIARILQRPNVFKEAYLKKRSKIPHVSVIQIALLIGVVSGILLLTQAQIIVGAIILILSLAIYLFIFAKLFSFAAEQTFIRDFSIAKLTEGEWVVEDIWSPKTKNEDFITHNTNQHKVYTTQYQSQDLGNVLLHIFSEYPYFARILQKRKQKQERKLQQIAEKTLQDTQRALKAILTKELCTQLQSLTQTQSKSQMVPTQQAQNSIAKLATKTATEILRAKTRSQFERIITNIYASKSLFSKLETETKKQYAQKIQSSIMQELEKHLFSYTTFYVCGTKDLGISQEQITILRHTAAKSVKVKVGIPFLPSFLLAYIYTIWWGNALAHIFLAIMV